jgi:hypothetical protein
MTKTTCHDRVGSWPPLLWSPEGRFGTDKRPWLFAAIGCGSGHTKLCLYDRLLTPHPLLRALTSPTPIYISPNNHYTAPAAALLQRPHVPTAAHTQRSSSHSTIDRLHRFNRSCSNSNTKTTTTTARGKIREAFFPK